MCVCVVCKYKKRYIMSKMQRYDKYIVTLKSVIEIMFENINAKFITLKLFIQIYTYIVINIYYKHLLIFIYIHKYVHIYTFCANTRFFSFTSGGSCSCIFVI